MIAAHELETVPVGPNTRATFKRYRVRDVCHGLYQRCILTAAQWHACERFRNDQDIMLGVYEPVDLPLGWRDAGIVAGDWIGPTGRMIDASRRVERAWAAIGPDPARLLVKWVICAPGTLAGFENDQKMRNGSATAMLLSALDRLADCYSGIAPR